MPNNPKRGSVNSFFVNNPFPMFVFDRKTLCFLEANHAAAHHYGYSRDEFAGMKIMRLRVGTEDELIRQLENLPAGAEAFYPATHRKRDGSLIDVEVAIGMIGLNGSDVGFSIVRDVTAQRRMQASLARVLRAAEIGIWEMDIATNAVTWTDEVYRIFGYDSPAAPISLERYLSHILPEDRPRFDAAFADALVSGIPYDLEYRIRRVDGAERTLHESVVIELSEERNPARAMGIIMNVTDRRALQQELRMRSDALATAQRIARLGSWDIDLVTGRLDWSRELYEIYGMTPGANAPKQDELWKHDHPDDAQQVLRTVSRARYNRTQYNLDHRIVRLDGETRWVQEQGEYAYDSAGKPNRFIGTMLDITERKRAEERVEYLAGHDQVTGLPNYTLLLDRLRQSLVQAHRDGSAVAVAYLDVDRFKGVNDAVGYDAGDEVLQEIARRLQVSVLPSDSVSRAGGDEFIIILPDIEKSIDIGGRARNILRVFESPFQAGNREFHFTASMGISVFPSDIGDASQLIRNADMAMYQGKGKAGNNFQFFSAEMHERTIRRLSLERDLRHAIENDELFLVYQPIVEARTHALTAVEALVRWQPTGKPIVGPAEFIPIAEDTGLIVSIGEWIIRQACRQWRAWCDSGVRPVRMAANISGKQLESPDFIPTLKNALADAKMAAEFLDLEITETVLMTQAALPTLDSLKALGLRLVIDDFGTGFSSLAYLKRMPIECLKIDQSFVAYAQTGRAADVPISTAIIAIARNLGLQVVAEGIETETQASLLRDLGCDLLQGYYFAVPSAPELVAAMIRDKS